MRERNIAGVNINFCADEFGLIAVRAGARYGSPSGHYFLRKIRLTNAITMTASMIDISARKMSKDNSGFNKPPKLVKSLIRPSCSEVHTRRMISGIISKNIMTVRT